MMKDMNVAAKRYYYTDPLAAAWMAKHHGMRFDQFRVMHPDDMALPGYTPQPNNVFIGWAGSRKFYIIRESLHLLEPQVGDMVFSDGFDGDLDHGAMITDEADRLFHSEDTVIQRNGLAFMWPEVEV